MNTLKAFKIDSLHVSHVAWTLEENCFSSCSFYALIHCGIERKMSKEQKGLFTFFKLRFIMGGQNWSCLISYSVV